MIGRGWQPGVCFNNVVVVVVVVVVSYLSARTQKIHEQITVVNILLF